MTTRLPECLRTLSDAELNGLPHLESALRSDNGKIALPLSSNLRSDVAKVLRRTVKVEAEASSKVKSISHILDRSDSALVAEKSAGDRLKSIESNIETITTTMAATLAGIETKVSRIDTKVSRIDPTVTRLDTTVTRLDTTVTRLERSQKRASKRHFNFTFGSCGIPWQFVPNEKDDAQPDLPAITSQDALDGMSRPDLVAWASYYAGGAIDGDNLTLRHIISRSVGVEVPPAPLKVSGDIGVISELHEEAAEADVEVAEPPSSNDPAEGGTEIRRSTRNTRSASASARSH